MTNPSSPRGIGAALVVFASCSWLLSCGSGASTPAPSAASLAGPWRGVLTSPGGELPFGLEITESGGALAATVVNGEERRAVDSVELRGSTLRLGFEIYDSEIVAEVGNGGTTLAGSWSKTIDKGTVTMPFSATKGDAPRFQPRATSGLAGGLAASVPKAAGTWVVGFEDANGFEPGEAEFAQQGSRVTGTFLTPTGDYRYLEGSYEDGLLRLSVFDGAHAFLFHARAQPDGSLAGDFWSRESYHATWKAKGGAPGENILPDAWSEVGMTNTEGRFGFRFPSLDEHGGELSLTDERFRGKVVIVNLFGSWCPNCNDEAPLLAAWAKEYGPRGLEVVGLAYEMTSDLERSRRQVRRFTERHGIDYPIAIAGTSDKKLASSTLPDLTAVLAFPTTVFVGRDGKVKKIHSGFAGPGTGTHHRELVEELRQAIEALL